jgi:hypothetical protein
LNPASEDDDLWILQKALGLVRFVILTNCGAGAVSKGARVESRVKRG